MRRLFRAVVRRTRQARQGSARGRHGHSVPSEGAAGILAAARSSPDRRPGPSRQGTRSSRGLGSRNETFQGFAARFGSARISAGGEEPARVWLRKLDFSMTYGQFRFRALRLTFLDGARPRSGLRVRPPQGFRRPACRSARTGIERDRRGGARNRLSALKNNVRHCFHLSRKCRSARREPFGRAVCLTMGSAPAGVGGPNRPGPLRQRHSGVGRERKAREINLPIT